MGTAIRHPQARNQILHILPIVIQIKYGICLKKYSGYLLFSPVYVFYYRTNATLLYYVPCGTAW